MLRSMYNVLVHRIQAEGFRDLMLVRVAVKWINVALNSRLVIRIPELVNYGVLVRRMGIQIPSHHFITCYDNRPHIP